MRKKRPATVRHYLWTENGIQAPLIQIFSGGVFVRLEYDEARQVVDAVHDLCDLYEAQERENT